MSADGTRDLRARLRWQSALAALICVLADTGSFLISGPLPPPTHREWAVLVLIVVADACLAAPARFSVAVAVLHAAMLVVTPVLLVDVAETRDLSSTGALIAGYLAGAWSRPVPAGVALAALCAAVAVNEVLVPDGASGTGILFEVLSNAVLPWIVGRHTTTRRGHLAALEQRAERREHDERLAVAHAVAEERSTIARDLHDVISHHVSAIAVHAGAARIAMKDDAQTPVGRALGAVETGSRAAMLDLRRLLDVLHSRRSDTEQPGLHNLEELLAGIDLAGLPVTFTTTGAGPITLPDSLELALYRIAQEALTNALRHGGSGPVTVELDHRDGGITLAVTNPLPAAPPEPPHASPGRGLDGIRQRVALFQGDAEIGPDAGGGHWRVRVRFTEESLC